MERPIFLVGTMRSGSTLLRLILDSHERLSISDESGFLRAVEAARSIPDHAGGEGWYRRFGVDDAAMNERLRSFYDEIFSAHARAEGKSRWGDKTPFHINLLPLIGEVFPDAQIVGIVRHPGAMVASQLRRGVDFPTALRTWTSKNVRLLRAARRKDLSPRLAVVRYEDLVTAPEPTLRELLAFLGEAWSSNLLRHHEIQRERGTPRLAEGGTRTREAIDGARTARWTGELDAAQRREVLAATAAVRSVFGYDDVGFQPLAEGLVVSGPDLAARQRAVGPAALVRPRRPDLPAASASPLASGAAGRLLQMLRTDPAYALRRLPVVVRSLRRSDG